MKLSTVSSLANIDADHWNALAHNTNLFVQYDFLFALERHNCLHPWGWQPHYLLAYDNNELVGACPTYIKDNSYGEFVFDWAWADAYHRNAMQYYPKLVTAIPYTPAQGTRLLTKKENSIAVKNLLIQGAIETVEKDQFSSSHWLFCDNDDMEALTDQQLLTRFDYQFHWQNKNYENFDHFLSQLSSKKRKNIRRERRKVAEENVRIRINRGTELSDEEWQILYNFYQLTFMKKSGTATMTLDFFQAMAHKLVAIFAEHENNIVAGAICFQDDNTLYGRHWGCYEKYDSLHFEVCYYSGIEYCINNNIKNFEPGAQGEHKIARGFLPVKTQSAHWIAHEGFRHAIADFLDREQKAMKEYGVILSETTPYRKI
jgi:predicted N-acyltransferase